MFASRMWTLTKNADAFLCFNVIFDIVVRETPNSKMKQCLHQGCEHILTLDMFVCLIVMFDIVVRKTSHPKMKECLHQGCEHLLTMWCVLMFKCDFWYCCKRNFTVKDETMFWIKVVNTYWQCECACMFDICRKRDSTSKDETLFASRLWTLTDNVNLLVCLNIWACMFKDAVWYCHKRDSTSKDETKFASRLWTLTGNVNLLLCWNMMFDIVVRETPHPKMKQCLHQGCEHLLQY